MEFESIGVLSAGKVMGIVYAAFGVIVGAFFALFAMAGAAMPQPQQAGGPNPMVMIAGMGIMAIIFMPIIYGIMGFIGGIISALIYNLVASMFGGLELDFQQRA